MFYARLIDSEEIDESYCSFLEGKIKLNGYLINDSGERLQLFIVNEHSTDLVRTNKELQVSNRSYYSQYFDKCVRFVKEAIKGTLDDDLQDSSPSKVLVSFLNSSGGADQIDVVEIIQITGSATVETRGASPSPKRIEFLDEKVNLKYKINEERKEKQITIIKRLVDLNFLYNVLISKGNREALTINFEREFQYKIPFIQAADEEHFESYLCVLPASILSELYKRYSSRLLEKNVRSFLQFRGVNKGIKETIRKEPEKFIAYNNGLTITAVHKELITDDNGIRYIKSLKDFQIVNGGQTTATIYFAKKEGLDISKVNIMAKINVAKKNTEEQLEELISNISTYSNAQNRVSRVDLRSRNPQLVKLKNLSESVLTPSGIKWFFERAKGEFYTMIRKSSKNQKRIKKEYPSNRRFSKEQLAKYYMAWGNQPYLVKKGGEKVFRLFIEELCGNEEKEPLEVNRKFYEKLIAKIILFRSMEKIYGQGKNAMGQLRSAVIPYSLAVIFNYFSIKKSSEFNLLRVWKNESIEPDLEDFLRRLMMLVNALIKKYSQSEDYGEYSKKQELWEDISTSKELDVFMQETRNLKLFKKYISKRK